MQKKSSKSISKYPEYYTQFVRHELSIIIDFYSDHEPGDARSNENSGHHDLESASCFMGNNSTLYGRSALKLRILHPDEMI
uniref:Uncharacterized protein n=1 Tax=Trichuris muris TaxID=70415 RepID=A0A5S6QIT9_TRIMR